MSSPTSSKSIPLNINQGTILGKQEILQNGFEYFAFKGIPYAKPPIGSLRLKPPVPLEKFPQSPLDCTRERGVSFQVDPLTKEFTGCEDCLFLNVYTPRLKSKKSSPVMVWIHGGGFVTGSGNGLIYFPLYLLQENVIVVTLNYRLGPLGFLYLPEGDISGNAGLKDQRLALRWVKENVNKFNGDPENITLFGQSAGSASVHFHVLSLESRKYFHKAILQSGSALNEWAIQKNAIFRARKLAELMGCESKSDKEIGEFFRTTMDLKGFYSNMLNTLTADEKRRDLPIVFPPAVDAESETSFIPKLPLKTSSEANTINIPLMIGYTSKEGIITLPVKTKTLKIFEKDLGRFIPRYIDLDPQNSAYQVVETQIRDFYFKGESLGEKNLSELADLMSDIHFCIGINLTAELLSRKQFKSPVYFYKFSYDGELNIFKKLFRFEHLPGASHADDIFYIFNGELSDSALTPDSEEDRMKRKICKLWANFAKYSNPTPLKDDLLNVTWNSVKKINDEEKFTLDYLEIDKTLEMKQNPDKERIEFWRKVYTKRNKGLLHAKL